MDTREDAIESCGENACNMRREALSDTCSGDTCSGASGDCDDTISLCSWTTDQGDWPEVEQMHAPCEYSVPYDSVQYAMPPRLLHRDFENVPVSMFSWYAPAVLPGSTMPYAVNPGCIVEASFKQDALRALDSDKAGSVGWQPKRGTNAVGASQHAPGTWTTNVTGAKCLESTRKSPVKNVKDSETISRVDGQKGDKRTTIILQNVPSQCTRDILVQILDDQGFFGGYDFVHLPIDFQTKAGLGYALVNMVSHRVALRAHQRLAGFSKWPFPSENICEVAWNQPHQGLAAHIDRYRNSPLMHESVPDAHRPALFQNGLHIAFPNPTTRIRPPRIRHQKADYVKA